jgi:hypothetical protein
MTKNLALAASITMLVAISGPAFARTAATNELYGPGPSDRQQAAYAFDAFAYDAFDQAMTTQTAEPDAYRYHGGPKYND